MKNIAIGMGGGSYNTIARNTVYCSLALVNTSLIKNTSGTVGIVNSKQRGRKKDEQ